MNIEAIKAMSAYELAERAGVSSPDALDSPGAAFLSYARDWYVNNHAQIVSSDYPTDEIILISDLDANGGSVPHPNHVIWQVFADLALWNWGGLDEGILGTITWEEITDTAATVAGEVASNLAMQFWQDDDANPDNV